jgi:CRP/FNR family transcriptional regulator, cyclic AMP receptor protein
MGVFTIEDIHRLFPGTPERTYSQGQIVIYDGDQPTYVAYVKSGAYKYYDIDRGGNEKIIYIGGAGGLFPMFYTFEAKPHVDAFYSTLCRSTFLMIPLTRFRETISESGDLSSSLLTWYAGEMDHMVMRLKSMEKSNAKQKVLEALLYLCNQKTVMRTIDAQWSRVIFPLSQQTLADLTGLTRETVNAAIRDIESLGVIRVPRKLMVEINHQNLVEAIDGP